MFVRLLFYAIWVTISDTLAVWLIYVLSCKHTVSFTFPAALYPHLHRCFWLRKLIGADVFYFWKMRTITSNCY